MRTERVENMCGGTGHVIIKHILGEKRIKREMPFICGGND